MGSQHTDIGPRNRVSTKASPPTKKPIIAGSWKDQPPSSTAYGDLGLMSTTLPDGGTTNKPPQGQSTPQSQNPKGTSYKDRGSSRRQHPRRPSRQGAWNRREATQDEPIQGKPPTPDLSKGDPVRPQSTTEVPKRPAQLDSGGQKKSGADTANMTGSDLFSKRTQEQLKVLKDSTIPTILREGRKDESTKRADPSALIRRLHTLLVDDVTLLTDNFLANPKNSETATAAIRAKLQELFGAGYSSLKLPSAIQEPKKG